MASNAPPPAADAAPSRAAVAGAHGRLALPVRADRISDGAAGGVVTRCPQCGAQLYDPADVELLAECLFCGHVEHSQDRGYYHGTGPR